MTKYHMEIGDIDSQDMGSAARACGGKPQWDYMPLQQIAVLWTRLRCQDEPRTVGLADLTNVLGWHQARGCYASAMDVLEYGTLFLMQDLDCDMFEALEEVIKVWEFGAQKYASFNWMKGMPWSKVVASAQRHVIALMRGGIEDSESGCHHGAHYICNAMMLVHYADHYKEGNDLPVQWYT